MTPNEEPTRLPSVTALANALHDVDDDVQFIRRDARNFPVVAARIVAALRESEARAAATPGQDEERWRKASESLEVIDGIVDDTHPEGDGCPLCHELDNLREVIDAALSASGETEP